MAKKRSKRGSSPDIGQTKAYEIHFFVPGSGFKAWFYSAESKEQALKRLKTEYPMAQTFWINLTRGKALAGPQEMRYLVWWKSYGGPDFEPHMVFVLDPAGSLVGSVPDIGDLNLQFAWDLAKRRSNNSDHRLEEVDESTASLIGTEIMIRGERFRDKVFRDWETGK